MLFAANFLKQEIRILGSCCLALAAQALAQSEISTARCRVASLLKARVVLIKCYRGVSLIFV